MEKIDFMNLAFRGLTKESLLTESSSLKIIVTVNAEFIVLANEDENFKRIICENFSTFDGQVPFLLARLKFPRARFEKISGSDFIYDICAKARQSGKRVFLLGGYPASNQGALSVIRERYGIEAEGFSPEYQPYPFSPSHNGAILERIEKFKPHYLLVGFGAKKQEAWIDEHRAFLESIGVQLAIGVGGTFEFVSSTISRAPRFIQKIGMEGVYRFVQEPNMQRFKRLIKSLRIFRYY